MSTGGASRRRAANYRRGFRDGLKAAAMHHRLTAEQIFKVDLTGRPNRDAEDCSLAWCIHVAAASAIRAIQPGEAHDEDTSL